MAAVSFLEEGQLQAVEELIGFRFTNRHWLLEALQAAGLINRDRNKKLAIIGDKVLGLIASNSYLAERGFLMGLDRYIVNNPAQGGLIPAKLMATTVEAILGAVARDSDSDLTVVENVADALGLSWYQ
ncbi:RNase3 domain protein [Aspergillus fischeri NRRL 181]|uniref:RNase3 domain protein n=1 Tax=Neosartorya fischeri (strain ATCC 1020 / DSM 3700 / CBS 544.65 / FGSC A1164 / JCM 1740 / NRRL 181 / WB 181) TaxID=331117 RepID=A1CVH9_NEOFI|nr:RNase3 domain protein [Aspergillus fischeri NRRL 181]EAW25756.1 RNase3 domain protein [Aspergillus fischeri NRRL 181]